MSAITILILGLIGLCFGWFIYSKYVAIHIFKFDPDFKTPAHELEDGVDYVPTNKYVLWGHHFTSVAGAAPIVGPAIAVYWGWVPAVLWVVFGSIFFAGVHDMGALWASVRHKGKSIGALSENVIGPRTRALYMVVVFLVLLMVNSVFGVVIANAFVSTPSAVLPAWSAIAVALVIGQLLHRNMMKLGVLTAIGVAVLYVSIYAGSEIPLSLPSGLPGLGIPATWIVILFVYAAIASMLPVWMLLQPRDFINGMQLAVGLLLLYGAVLISGPEITAPAFNNQLAEGTPSLLPLLFVTIACGAVSGFHGIVASGTTSKQLDKEPDARFVGYFAALGEGSLALITIIAVTGVALAASPEAWHETYSHFGAGSVGAFITGGANLIENGWGISAGLASTLLATMVALFAGTTMDSGVRLQRYIIQEWGEIYNIKWITNGVVATGIAVGTCLVLAFGAGGTEGNGGMTIWPLFGSTNQILAGMTLLVLSVMLIKKKRPALVTLIPMVFVLCMSALASTIIFMQFLRAGNYLLMAINAVVLITSLLVVLESLSVISKERAKQRAENQSS
ncbi:MAG TPA: carbon starvation protein A [Gammaproteobacteria bacterium]|jgi:carbon starvation protein|nr:carbon starvation protein A [Gammaproteobacteria bacterium]